MKLKTLVPFILVLVLLIGLVAWKKANVAPPAPIATQVGLKALAPEGLEKDAVARIEMYSGTAPEDKVVLERNGESWKITTLFDAPVNMETLDTFLDKAIGLAGEPRAKENSEAQLAEYSLKDDEAFHLQLFKSGAESPAMHVLVGKSPDFRTVFVRKDGDNQVFVESTNLRREAGVSDSGEDTTPKPTKWLQTTLLEQNKDIVNRIALQYPDKEIVFEKREVVVETPETTEGEGEATPVEPEKKFEWVIASGGFAETFTEPELQTLLGKFAMLAVTNVVDPEKKAEWGFDPPLYKLTLSRDDGDDIVLLGGQVKPAGDSYIQLEGVDPALIYQIAKYNFEAVFPQGSKLFSLPQWTVEKEAISRIEIQRPDGRIVLVKEGEAWRVTEPAITLELQKTTIDSLLAAASSLKPVDYVDTGQDAGAFDTTITIVTADETARTLHLGQPSKHVDGQYAKFDDSEKVLVLSRTDMEKINPPVRNLFTLSLLDFDMETVERIAVSHDGTELSLERSADKWQRTVNGKSAEALLNDVEEFVYALNAFQVDNFLLQLTPDSVQAASTITVNQTGQEPILLQLSAPSDGIYQAVISGMPYVFSVKTDEISRIVEDMQPLLNIPEETAETTDAVAATEEAPASIAMPAAAATEMVVEMPPPAEATEVVVEAAPEQPVIVMPTPATAE